MRFLLGVTAALVFIAAAWPQVAVGAATVVGSWEGESKCTVTNSPCHDEHVVYRIGAEKQFYRPIRVRKLTPEAN
jgi:hypothetical protein